MKDQNILMALDWNSFRKLLTYVVVDLFRKSFIVSVEISRWVWTIKSIDYTRERNICRDDRIHLQFIRYWWKCVRFLAKWSDCTVSHFVLFSSLDHSTRQEKQKEWLNRTTSVPNEVFIAKLFWNKWNARFLMNVLVNLSK